MIQSTLSRPRTDAPGTGARTDVKVPLTRTTWRLRLAVVSASLVLLAFLQEPSRIVPDTKLDLAVDPAGLLLRALHMWEPDGFFGQLGNQTYGYLFPMGPFFLLGDLIGAPTWAVQRAWVAVLLVAAFLGVVRLLGALGIGTPLTRVVAALAYALAPRMMSTLGPISVEALPMALAPWVLVPLVRGAVTGSPRRAAAASGLAILLVGGVNAVATAAVLPLAAWWLLTRSAGPRKRSLLIWWPVSVVLATLWWVVPLVLLGRYSPPFLDWIETASVTTSVTDPFSVVRGTSHWVGFLATSGGPSWPAAWTIVTAPALIIASALLAGAGLAGLARRDLPERSFLIGGLGLGFLLLSLGHVGDLAAPWQVGVRTLLDGPLAPLRNVHKFEPILRLVVVVGLAHLLSSLPVVRRRQMGFSRAGGQAVVAGLVVVVAMPLWTTNLAPRGAYAEIPGYWYDVARYLEAHDEGGRALVVPAASFGTYIWGTTRDEPLQALATTAWGVRDAVPLSSAGNIRILDALERRLEDGEGSPGLAPFLQRAGVRYLVVRNDLSPGAAGPRTIQIRQALTRSPGIRRVADFGPLLEGYRGFDLVSDEGLEQFRNAVEVYEVSVGSQDGDPRIAAFPADDVAVMSGGPEGLLPALDAGVASSAVILAGDNIPSALASGGIVLTDTYPRIEHDFGSVHGVRSARMSATDEYTRQRPVHDYWPTGPEGRQSLTGYVGVADVRASSSRALLAGFGSSDPASGPWAALDGDNATSWKSRSEPTGDDPWWEVEFESPRWVPYLDVALDELIGVPPSRLVIQTDSGEMPVSVNPTAALQRVSVPPGLTSRVRILVDRANSLSPGSTLALREVEIPGVEVTHTLNVAPATGSESASAAPVDSIVLRAAPGQRGGCAFTDDRPYCSPSLLSTGEDTHDGIVRTVDIPVGAWYRVAMTAVPRAGDALTALVGPLAADSVTAVGSSQLVPDPAAAAQSAVDGDQATAWIASATDAQPSISLSWGRQRRITGLQFLLDRFLGAAPPLKVAVSTGSGSTYEVFVDEVGLARIPPVVTDRLDIRVLTTRPTRSLNPATGTVTNLPFGVSEIRVLGAEDLIEERARQLTTGVPCGFGPQLEVDGEPSFPTSVETTRRALFEGRSVNVTACAGSGLVYLGAGTHTLRVPPTAEFLARSVTLARTAPQSPAPTQLDVVEWGATERLVNVPARGETQVIVVSENFNPGWRAEIDGQELEPFRVDGWRQGFVLPAGPAGILTLSYAPDAGYRTGLLVGAVGAMLLLVLLVVRGPSRLPALRAARRSWWGVGLGAACLLAVSGAAGVVAGTLALATRLWSARRGHASSWLAVTAVAVAAIVVAVNPWPSFAGASAAVRGLVAFLVLFAVWTAVVGGGPAAEPPESLGGQLDPPEGGGGSHDGEQDGDGPDPGESTAERLDV